MILKLHTKLAMRDNLNQYYNENIKYKVEYNIQFVHNHSRAIAQT